MMEIEMKILEIPKKVVFEKMKKLGAKKKYSVLLRVKYFDFQDHRIYEKKDLLRIRETIFLPGGKRKTEVVYKIYKGVKKGCKIFDELEFWVDGPKSFEAMSELLKRLGFMQTIFYEKKRTLFEYVRAHGASAQQAKSGSRGPRSKRSELIRIEFDEHPGIPPLMEIEAQNEKEVNKIVKALNLEDYEKSSETIEQLMKRKYPNIRLNGLMFR